MSSVGSRSRIADEAAIAGLLISKAQAGVTLGYEADLPSDDDLLRHVTSLANAEGGDLLIGIRTRRDSRSERAVAALGVQMANVDNVLATMAQALRGLQPNVAGVTIATIGTYARGPVVAIHVPVSDGAPHSVDGVFWVRRTSGIEIMTMEEVQTKAAYWSDLQGRLSTYLTSRFAEVRAGQTPVPLRRVPLLLAHLVPRDALRRPSPLSNLSTSQERALRPIRSVEGRTLPGAQDFVRIEADRAYTALARNGVIEAVTIAPHSATLKRLHERSLANDLRVAVRRYVRLQNEVGAPLPIYLSVALADAEGYRLGPRGAALGTDLMRVDPVPIHDDPMPALQTTLDWLWQAAGHPRCAVPEPSRSR